MLETNIDDSKICLKKTESEHKNSEFNWNKEQRKWQFQMMWNEQIWSENPR